MLAFSNEKISNRNLTQWCNRTQYMKLLNEHHNCLILSYQLTHAITIAVIKPKDALLWPI